jgi:hypothetical protein
MYNTVEVEQKFDIQNNAVPVGLSTDEDFGVGFLADEDHHCLGYSLRLTGTERAVDNERRVVAYPLRHDVLDSRQLVRVQYRRAASRSHDLLSLRVN